ncbi:MAG: hypothetical protein ACOYIE_09660 [Agathobaculum sp.]|jgi:hypothetical protein|uniref:hypothetical protein n=1 Tax=Agathobaculum sp. TaxID=2048138 RepID=UPI003D89EBBC
MNKQNSSAPAARGGITVLCFLLIIAGQAYLLRSMLFGSGASGLPMPFCAELFFCLLMTAGIVISCIRPTGWGSKLGCAIALALFILYAAINILQYDIFSSAYLSGIHAEYASMGGALVALKLVLALVGVTAGIPVAPRIDDREYARRLREKVQMQQAEWAKASAQGAQKDLNDTLEKLKATLSEEEMAALLAQLQQTAAQSSAEKPKPDPTEDAHGWGGGM